MKAAVLIEQYNTERPNNIADDVKLGWIKKVEGMIIREILETHEVSDLYPEEGLEEHLASFGMDSELIAKEPYDDVYMFYMDMRNAYNVNDNRNYNGASTMYNNAMLTFQQYVNRNYEAINRSKKLMDHSNL